MQNFIDVSDAFNGLLLNVNITRTIAGSYVNGVWAPGTSGIVPIRAVVQSATPKELQNFSEEFTIEAIKLHTQTALYSIEEVGKTDADVVSYNGHNWIIFFIADRKIGGYYKAMASRI